MTALILIFSQMFDWKNFCQSTICFLRSIYNQGCTLCYWDWWCWFNIKSFSTIMTALILILSQFFDWKNFWRSTFYFLRSIYGQGCNWCCWDWWCWSDRISCNARWPHWYWFCHRFLIERIFGGQLFVCCGQFTISAVLYVIETDGVDLT